MRIKLESEVEISADELVKNMSVTDIGELLTAAAEKLKDDNINRLICAGWFSDGLSEDGARFVAEAITKRFVGKK